MPLANRTRAGRRDCGGGAPFCAAPRAAQCAMRSKKKPCQPKTAKRFFGGPGSHGPSGQAKERTRILPVRRGFSAFGVPRRLPGRPLLRSLPLSGLLAFAPGAPAFFCRCSAVLFPACGPSACFVRAFMPVACLPAMCFLVRIFSSVFHPFLPHFCLSKFFSFVAHAATGTPFSFRKENGGKEPRGERRAAPLRTPLTVPCGQSSPLPRCWPAYAALRAANRRLTGKRLKSQGAELSFSSVSVRRRTPAP